MNILLVLIVLGMIIMHFGFWATMGGFFTTIFWIVMVIAIIVGFGLSVVYLIKALE